MRSIFISLRSAAAGLVLTFGMFGLTTSVFAQVNPGDDLVLDLTVLARCQYSSTCWSSFETPPHQSFATARPWQPIIIKGPDL